MSARYLAMALVLFALALTVGVWQQGQHSMEPEDLQRLEPDPACDLRTGACSRALPDGGELMFTVEPRGVPPMTPLAMEASLARTTLAAKWVDFVGVDMEMGFNRSALSGAGSGRFTGKGLIPVCVRERMLWEARVVLSDGNTWISVPFRFEVVRQ